MKGKKKCLIVSLIKIRARHNNLEAQEPPDMVMRLWPEIEASVAAIEAE
jgi:hypothetical protein